MSLSVDELQELESIEETQLNAANCCWNSVFDGCQWMSIGISSCHSCTNTN